MGKKIKIYESEIKRATRRKLMENYLEEEDDREMSGAFHRKDFKPSKREKDICRSSADIYMRHAPVQPDYRDYPGPINVSNQYDEEGYYIGEAEEVTTTGIKYSKDEIEKMKNPDGSVTVPTKTNESTEDLFKRFLNKK